MTETTSPPSSAPEPASTPADRWELPPEPDPGTVVQDREGTIWTRSGHGRGWTNSDGSTVASWSSVLGFAPLVRLVPAEQHDAGTDAELRMVTNQRDQLLRTVDQLRNVVARYRGTPQLREAALRVVGATSADARMRAIEKLGTVLDLGTADGIHQDPGAFTEPMLQRAVTISNLRRNVVHVARRVLDKAAQGAHTDLDLVLGDLRYAVKTLDEFVTHGRDESGVDS